MFEKNIIHVILGFSVVFTIFVSFCFILSIFILRKRNEDKSLNTVKKRFFGLFMELDDFSIFALAVNFIWILFLVFCIFDFTNFDILYLYTLLFLSVLFGIFSKSIKNLIIIFGSSCALYFALYISRLLYSYLLEIRFVWYVLVGNILLILFILLYASYFFIRNMNDVISKTKYIRRFRNEER